MHRAAPIPPPLTGPILVVDDDDALRNLILRRIRSLGYEAAGCACGKEALKAVMARSPRLMLLDQRLPDMEGADIVRTLDTGGVRIPFIIMTGQGDERLAVEVMKLGAADYLVKDMDFLDLFPGVLQRVLRILDTEQRLKVSEAEKAKLHMQLAQAQKMEAIGRLAGGVAHDFNNMLGVILGHAELAMGKTEPETRLFSHLQEIFKAAERSAALTSQLLAFARKQTVSPRSMDLNLAVEGMLSLLHRLTGGHIELIWQPSVLPARVKMDPSQVDQILANLCVNARDAIGDTGQIVLSTEVLFLDGTWPEGSGTVEGLPSGEYVLLSARDTGCGMTADVLEQIFEPFFTTKEGKKGTGLGLATLYGIVAQNGGGIRVESQPGKGSLFRIYLPLDREPGIPALRLENQAAGTAPGKTILLVEDETMILDITREMLESMGHTVLAAGSPEEALSMAEKQTEPLSLLLSDVMMPQMNGHVLAAQLKRRHPELKVLFMSGYTSDALSRGSTLDTGIRFIQKPFSMKTLTEKIREAFQD